MRKRTVVQLQLDLRSKRATLHVSKPLCLGRLCRARRKVYDCYGPNGRGIPVVFKPTAGWVVNLVRMCTDKVVINDLGDFMPWDVYATTVRSSHFDSVRRIQNAGKLGPWLKYGYSWSEPS